MCLREISAFLQDTTLSCYVAHWHTGTLAHLYGQVQDSGGVLKRALCRKGSSDGGENWLTEGNWVTDKNWVTEEN